MLPVEATVVDPFTSMPPLAVVVNDAPLKLRVAALPDCPKLTPCPAVGLISIVPPLVEIVLVLPPPAPSIVIGVLDMLPSFIVIADAPVAESVALLVWKNMLVELNVRAAPLLIVCVPERKISSVAIADELKLTLPAFPPGANVSVP
jgi:hypothetical protein